MIEYVATNIIGSPTLHNEYVVTNIILYIILITNALVNPPFSTPVIQSN